MDHYFFSGHFVLVIMQVRIITYSKVVLLELQNWKKLISCDRKPMKTENKNVTVGNDCKLSYKSGFRYVLMKNISYQSNQDAQSR